MHTFHNLSASTEAGRNLFSELSITLYPGVLTCLTGPNGSGKTTLLNLLRAQASYIRSVQKQEKRQSKAARRAACIIGQRSSGKSYRKDALEKTNEF